MIERINAKLISPDKQEGQQSGSKDAARIYRMVCTRRPRMRGRRCSNRTSCRVRHHSDSSRHCRSRDNGSRLRRAWHGRSIYCGSGNSLRGYGAGMSRRSREGSCKSGWSAQLTRGYRAPHALTRPRTREMHGGGVGLRGRVGTVDVPRLVRVVARDQVDYLPGGGGEVTGGDAAIPAVCEVDVCRELVLMEA